MTTPSDAGRFRHRATIIRRNEMNGGDYNESKTVETPAEVRWMAIEPVTARENVIDGAMTHEVTHNVRMRYCSLSTSDVIEYRGRRFEIVSIFDVNEDRTELKVQCIERTT